MSLSQKHSGKVLVPWFNISEWRTVYDLIYCEGATDWPRALQILKIWKHRTPLLSAGVEGTLIVLEALTLKTDLSTYEIGHIFATSLVRFLNLCAANSARQGTFYKTAMENELPKWLIGIRHEIAHSHKVPSVSMLKLSLEFCLGWLRGKYWDVQFEQMDDFVVGAGKVDLNALKKGIERFIAFTNRTVRDRVNEALSKGTTTDNKESCDKICSILIDDLAVLSTDCELDESGNSTLPETFLDKWNELMNVIYVTGMMPELISKLFEYTVNGRYELLHRKIASLWIKEIYAGLRGDSGVSFHSPDDSLRNKNFLDQVLDTPSPFTGHFLEDVLRYNDAPESFIEGTVSLVSAFNPSESCSSDKIYTVEDLGVEEMCEETEDAVIADVHPRKETNSRWVLIEDTSPYDELPLGILPHQERNINPLFVV